MALDCQVFASMIDIGYDRLSVLLLKKIDPYVIDGIEARDHEVKILTGFREILNGRHY